MTHALNILLIDDDPDHCELISRALRDGSRDVRIQCATNCSDALAALSREKFDLVLTDFNLEDGQADALLCFIREHQLACPTIVVSGSDEQDVVIRSMRSGSFDFLHKDDAVVSAKLWDRLDAVIGNHANQQRERRRMERRVFRLEQLATRDPLTGLANRRALERQFGDQGRHLMDRRGECVVIMVDIDHFKQINDSYGHDCGDRVLRTVARAMRQHCERSDLLARWGGEEFIMCRPDSSLAVGMHWAEQVRNAVAQITVRWRKKRIGVTISIGVHAEPCVDIARIAVSSADQAMYYAKQNGRDRVCSTRHALFADLVGRLAPGDPVGRYRDLLAAADGHLGPTQRAHLTAHSMQVSDAAWQLARLLNIPQELRQRVRCAGMLHDIGKFCVPECVLDKPSGLSEEECQLIRRHPHDGADFARLLGVDVLTAACILRHHDRHDTPRPTNDLREVLGGQVLHVADAFVTMTSDRSYQPARSPEEALTELRRQRGRQFAPHVVDAALNCFAGVAIA
ncbi:MAG: diguanylate cyclase [Phycisphaerales bacterium]|nr:diguanylate cyclase [Phycisphaerales bacterium]